MCILPKKRPLLNTYSVSPSLPNFFLAMCAWLDRESLPCLPFKPSWHGPVLLISLCNGVGCAALAFVSLRHSFLSCCRGARSGGKPGLENVFWTYAVLSDCVYVPAGAFAG